MLNENIKRLRKSKGLSQEELAVAGTILHGFEFVFVRLAPIVFLLSVVGIIITYKNR